MPSETPLLRVDAGGHGIDAAVEFYACVYDSDDIRIDDSGETFSFRYRAVGDADLAVVTSAVGARRWGRIDPGRQYLLAWSSTPGIVLDTDSSDPVRMRSGVPLMYPAGRSFRFDAPPATQHLIRFDGDFLEAVAAAARDEAPAPLTFRRDVPAAAMHALHAMIAAAGPKLVDPATDRTERTRLNLAVAEAVVAAFDAAPSAGADAGPAVVRLAREYIVAHAAEDLSIGQVASAAGVSVRTAQASFLRHVGMSPMMFLRETRLHRVRARLLANDPSSTTVGEQATLCGFNHLGRFSAYYADRFGELPSETLRRRRLI